ncbi:hypothetical protein OGAPHI_001263 [Ogataea philodendri]|uniref:Coatomer subunit delta n=1 Tax=Ogataea philodendri TaxID=1378263 RepID=A0A9P8PF70_9ASCO|nr:uncharacterized protein OGAPHI_001263 [Ogataea philodendri]KAH3670747.1 hypothetical protein OGAPHI_001263 [Ogataea philodendri]
MVVLAASICTRGGKAILSRQFRDLSKDRVTSLLAEFPALLLDTTKTQHTTVQGENVRYVYSPLEEFYVVLITNKHSNILQDIDTLNLFSQTIMSILRVVDEREIFDNCFEILNAFDEIINLGYKENLSLSQIITFLEMESHEEKIQEIIERNKELEAAEERKRKAKEIQRREMMKKNMESYEFQQSQNFVQPSYQPAAQPAQQFSEPAYSAPQKPFAKAPPRKGGLQLGKKAASLGGEAQPLLISTPSPRPTSSQSVSTPEPAGKEKIANNGILILINEKFTGQITREGSISTAEVQGDLQLRINDPSLAFSLVNLQLGSKDGQNTVYKTHPKVDKNLFQSDSIIGMKDQTKPFASNDQPLGVLRWKSVSKTSVSEDANTLLPLVLTTWVNNNEDGTVNLTFEYEALAEKQLDEASLLIPAGEATIESSDHDNVSLQYIEEGLLVKLTGLQENPSGSFEIVCHGIEDEEALFPMEVVFSISEPIESGKELGDVAVVSVVSAESKEELPFDVHYNGSNEGYYII